MVARDYVRRRLATLASIAGRVPPSTVQMPVVWTARHRGPCAGRWLLAGRADRRRRGARARRLLHDELTAAGRHDRRCPRPRARSDHGRARCRRSSTSWPRAHAAWVAEGHLDDPGQPQVVPYLFALPGFAARYDRRPPPGDDPGRGRAVRDGHDVADQRGHVRRRLLGRPRRPCTPRPRARGRRAAYAAVRPPGHHAGPAFYGGSCYFNNAAAAAQRLRDGGVERVAIVDIDAHQGNGTQEIFWERGDVLYASVHVDPAAGLVPAPRRTRRRESVVASGQGATVNEPIAAGVGRRALARRARTVCATPRDARARRRRRVARGRCSGRRSGGAR